MGKFLAVYYATLVVVVLLAAWLMTSLNNPSMIVIVSIVLGTVAVFSIIIIGLDYLFDLL